MEKNYRAQLADLATAGAELGEKDCHSTGLGDLPELCIATILRLITPRDVARLACVSPIFRAASYSDLVWETMLPPSYCDILAEAPDAPPPTSSKKEIYDFLSNGVLLQNGTREYWLDRATGGICLSIGARGLSVNWGDYTDYWTWKSGAHGSRFTETAFLKLVWWLEIRGWLQCFLSPGTYTLSWRLFQVRGDLGPVTFSLEATDNDEVQNICSVTPEGARISTEEGLGGQQQSLYYRLVDKGRWMELDVGEFTVERKDSPVSLSFSLKDTDCGKAKRGLYLDGVVIRPSNLKENLICSEELSTRKRSTDTAMLCKDIVDSESQLLVMPGFRRDLGMDMPCNATSYLDPSDRSLAGFCHSCFPSSCSGS